MLLIFFIISFVASCVGAICGIGGGIIIKPVLDVFGIFDVTVINFLSSCTVFAMTLYTIVNNKIKNISRVNTKVTLPLAIGATLGGLCGNRCFLLLYRASSNKIRITGIQAICLFVITLGTLLYTMFKTSIRTLSITNNLVCIVIGLLLGFLSSFLGIGGGPVNLVILFFFFSMSTKIAVENSLYIIFFSQFVSVFLSIIAGNSANTPVLVLIVMILGGIVGGICGRKLNRKLSDINLDKLFIILMILLIIISIRNIMNCFMGSIQ